MAETQEKQQTSQQVQNSTSNKTIKLIIKRQKDQNSSPYEESFEIPYRENMNVIAALMEIRRNPINTKGEKTTPVTWDMNCLEEVCGACSMVINGKARQSCSAIIDQLEQPIRLEPMTTFPVIRDLQVDRTRMFDNLKRMKAWVPIDGTYDLGPGPRMPEKKRQTAYELSKCMTCGVCLEVCPNVTKTNSFVGAQAISQVRLFNLHPTGAMTKDERLDALMDQGGLQACGNSQNCVQACPKSIPLTTSIAAMNRETSFHMFKSFFGSDHEVE
ncbi:TPA: succinate dehydrogenase iron-sulfur subunit [Staphylococcus pseudintermedius]|uniref:succinate dehydrogenase iron-sulfur subunit n=1 Tax=Staphylococcus pseudintermedius TaxID=283734 RepID=UPI0018F4D390|nr:succinate dehydrogenase iron-sulfur subunit [Staphylococcus pseudintermedius]EGQ3668050.1 succinate dehydrogenase iron-sulfur subunit [Staphylococcus pseudintermedius]EGQ3669497.1 succinate dehydrogenase iron-sulfur subunit [Staphylococcus pseudintermedius]EGQ4051586.1 succinate dehydrogenase iron-sulfur subunit [Staphylococcus pseudintermedius]EJO7127313.1 succinate dehydrogenase iron-sulfur subunit [Staphylococcus pseudintermedius]EJO7129011.1 succinate dehydrogenase iron-sulfur subunit [